MWALGFDGLGFGFQGLGLGVLGCRVWDLGLGPRDLGFRVFGMSGSGCRDVFGKGAES